MISAFQFDESKTKVVRGGKSDALYCAFLYLALKEEDVPRTFKGPSFIFFVPGDIALPFRLELATSSGCSESEIRKFYKVVTRILPTNTKKAQPVNPADLVVQLFCDVCIRFLSDLSFSEPLLLEDQSSSERCPACLRDRPQSI